MTIEDLGRAVYHARAGRHAIFVTRTPAQRLLGFLKQVTNPSDVMLSMRKAIYKNGSIIITDRIDKKRIAATDRVVIIDEDCVLAEFATSLAEHKEEWSCSQ